MKYYEMRPGPEREAAKKQARAPLEYVARDGAVTEWRSESNRRFYRHIRGGPFVRMDADFRDVAKWLALLWIGRTPAMRLRRVADGILVSSATSSQSRVVTDMQSFAEAHAHLFPEAYLE